jgi:integrase
VNPIKLVERQSLPRVEASRPSYFTDAELAALWPVLAHHFAPVYLALCQTAVTTGMRQGELVALEWRDVDLGSGDVIVRRGYRPGVGVLDSPKGNRERVVDLTPAARAVFESSSRATLRRGPRHAAAPALVARLALQNGASLQWVQRQLGHSSITLTADVYGRWSRAAEKEQAAKLTAFPIEQAVGCIDLIASRISAVPDECTRMTLIARDETGNH